MLKNLDKLVENSEYKEAQKYLEPLKFVNILIFRKNKKRKNSQRKIEIL